MSLPPTHPKEQARRGPCGAGVSPALALLALLSSYTLTPAAEPPLKHRPLLRRPIAAAWIEPGKLLAVANQRSGTVSIVDIPRRKVVDEIAVGERLADITAGPRGNRLFAVDEKRHDLIILDRDGDSLRVVNRVPVSPYPVSVAISLDGSRITVASLWSRKLTILEPNIDLPPETAEVRKLAEIPLPFAPRKQLFLPDGKVVVCDAFGGEIRFVNSELATIVDRHQFVGHAIRDLARKPDDVELLIVFQRNSEVRQKYASGRNRVVSILAGMGRERGENETERSAVRAGLLQDVAVPFAVRERGIDGRDPTSLTSIDGSSCVVTAGGTDQLLFVDEETFETKNAVTVGRRPIAALVSYPGKCTVVVNAFADSLSLVELESKQIAGTVILGAAADRTVTNRGEELFYDARLSAGGWMSCHSCHTDGHTSGQLADTLGDGTYGTPKRIPTLLGTRLTDKWAWSGEVRELHEQVQKSLENTMHAPKFSPQDVLDITAFLHTLPPPPPLQPATKAPKVMEQLVRGESLFGKLGCAKCHVPPLTYTSPEVYDVGLEDEKGLKKFNPPSLRGVSQSYSFFHDGRAKTLEAVFTEHAHQLDRPLEKAELADLLRFLRSL